MKEKVFNLIAHRGFSERSPENTIQSFDLALKEGFNNFEFDVQLTKDKIPVVIHDSDLIRTTGIKGIISENSITNAFPGLLLILPSEDSSIGNFSFAKYFFTVSIISGFS